MSKASPLEDLGLPLGGTEDHDALDAALAELQGVIDKDHDLGPLDEAFGLGDAAADDDDMPIQAQAPAPVGGLQELVMSIPVQLDVVIGSAEMPVADLIAMEAGSVVTLNRKIGEAVDICVNGTKIATGEIQSLEDDPSRLGVKIISLEKS